MSGYVPLEKREIARRYLLPRQLEAHGLTSKHLKVSAKVLSLLADGYTREVGVRQLERALGRVCRKVAAQAARLPDPAGAATVVLAEGDLPRYLGPKRHRPEVVERCKRPGVVVGLAWTSVGGEILFIEAAAVPGSGKLELTGKLGEVMTESARLAHTWIRSHAARYGIPPERFRDRDIHLHVPAGAVPKDGPSAGLALVCALASLLWRDRGRPTRARTATTGEITLRGAVLPVGGIKEKVVGAKRAGIKRIVLSDANEPDVEEIPAEVRRGVGFVYVSGIDEAIEAVIGRPGGS